MKKVMNKRRLIAEVFGMLAIGIGLLIAVVMMTSCSKSEADDLTEEKQDTLQSMVITFDFGPTIRPMTRASLSELSMTDLWCFDYMGGTLKQTVHQASTDTGFGSLSMSLDYGEHTFYFVASRGSDPTIDTEAKTITWGIVRDTFHASLSLNVQPTSSTNQSVNLSRVVGRLRISVTDAVPTTAEKLTITPTTWYYGLRYETGDAVASSASPIVINIPSSYIGTTDLSASCYTISDPLPWQTNVTASLVASDESVIGSVTIPDVPIQRNHITSYSGGIVGANRGMTLGSTDEWIEDTPVNW